MEKSEIRKDYFLNKYVVIAPKRAKFSLRKHSKSVEENGICYFCPETMSDGEVIVSRTNDSRGEWKVLTLENKFPALSFDNPRAFGKQEVIIETPKHNSELQDLSIDEIVDVFDVYNQRYKELSETPGVKYVLVFKNEGGKAGASIHHSHSQVYALPMIPPEVKDEFLAYNDYKVEHSECPYCDIIKDEAKKKNRIIWEDENFFVLSPFASRSPYGAWFLPKRHVRNMLELSEKEKFSLAKALKAVLHKLEDLDIAYNYFFHNNLDAEDYHMHLKLSPRPNVWAGLELGTGIIINPISPEFAAKYYRGEVKLEPEADKKHLKVS